MLIKTEDLTGAALDWAVATAQGWTRDTIGVINWGKHETHPAPFGFWKEMECDFFSPSTDWAQGGPIIEREGIAVWRTADGVWCGTSATTGYGSGDYIDVYDYDSSRGPTPLIAAMRCYVVSKLGAEVDIPQELVDARA
jgi:hypothetical protein